MNSGFQLRPGERVLAEVGANLFRGIEAVGGRMRVTDQRLPISSSVIRMTFKPRHPL